MNENMMKSRFGLVPKGDGRKSQGELEKSWRSFNYERLRFKNSKNSGAILGDLGSRLVLGILGFNVEVCITS
jgi:hypothetical protein